MKKALCILSSVTLFAGSAVAIRLKHPNLYTMETDHPAIFNSTTAKAALDTAQMELDEK